VSMSQEEITPIFASLQDFRERLKNCSSCAQRRELIQRWMASGRPNMKMDFGVNSYAPPNMPRDISRLFSKEK
jgi:hypothetical protein